MVLRTVKDACVLHENALNINVSDQIEQLDGLITGEGNGSAFFEKTHMTQGMRTLVTEGIARLAGKSNQAVFHLKQAMGGGKTHLLVGFGLLAKHPDLRAKVCPEVPYIGDFGSAKIAAFSGRNQPEEFFWGEVAKQLGKAHLFTKFWENGPQAPGENDWLQLFDDPDPILILLDEMPPYFTYYNTKQVGQGTVADIVTRAFANMLTAAGKKARVCVVISDLSAAYEMGTSLINRALTDAYKELGRQERNIVPVDLAGNEVYDILRKRLFKKLPDRADVEDVAAAFGRTLEEASKAKAVGRSADAIADEIVNTYPFHPRLKNLIALFKENENFKQTRGLLELASRLLKSVWERPNNDVYLIGAQHFDLRIQEVRSKLEEISEMRDVIAKDLWDVNGAAHAQVVDAIAHSDSGSQVGVLLLVSSLSTAVNSVKGLTREEIAEYLVTPVRAPSEFLAAFDALAKDAWYLHHTPDGRYYFDRQENLTKMLKSYADTAPEDMVENLIKAKLSSMFKPNRKTVYEEVKALPTIDEVVEAVRRHRTLLIVSPDSKLPPEVVKKFFESLTQKNNVCVLTGQRTEMGSLKTAARQIWAGEKAAKRINEDHPQAEELKNKRDAFEQQFMGAFLGLFDRVFFPYQRAGGQAELMERSFDVSRAEGASSDGEKQIEKTLAKQPAKLILDVEKDFDTICAKAEMTLWPEGLDEARWDDIRANASEKAGMYWLPPGGFEQVKTAAVQRGRWEDLGNGYISKKPREKTTSVQVTAESEPDDEGKVRLKVSPLDAGPKPVIYYAEDGPVSEHSSVLSEQELTTKALRVRFLAVDTTGRIKTGDPVEWTNKLVVRSRLFEQGGKRMVELRVAPRGTIRYTLDFTEPRDGTEYTGPFEIGDDCVTVLTFAEADGLEAKESFNFQPKGKKGLVIEDKPPVKISAKSYLILDSRGKTFKALADSKTKGIQFQNLSIRIGTGTKIANLVLGEVPVTGEYLEAILTSILSKFDKNVPVTMSFRQASFASGFDFKEFMKEYGIELQQSEVEQ
jgi:hypothetical protein